jgi:hypothetical protein
MSTDLQPKTSKTLFETSTFEGEIVLVLIMLFMKYLAKVKRNIMLRLLRGEF